MFQRVAAEQRAAAARAAEETRRKQAQEAEEARRKQVQLAHEQALRDAIPQYGPWEQRQYVNSGTWFHNEKMNWGFVFCTDGKFDSGIFVNFTFKRLCSDHTLD